MTNLRKYRPMVLIILDGLGMCPDNEGNAVTKAYTPNLNQYWLKSPHCYLQASGNAVGLPKGVMGNSEVGHMSIGGGTVIFQELAKIDREIADKRFLKNEVLNQAMDHAIAHNGRVHIIGLLSNGRVHSSLDHLFSCIEFCGLKGLRKESVLIHAFTDGRDTPPQSAEDYLKQLEEKCSAMKVGQLATIVGRYYAMDRDKRWDRTKKAYDLIVNGVGTKARHWKEAIDLSYKSGITDEYIEPYIIDGGSGVYKGVKPGDSVLFFNYRPDRALQLSEAFDKIDFSGWNRPILDNVYFAGFTNYLIGFNMARRKEDIERYGTESQMVRELFEKEIKRAEQLFPKNQLFPIAVWDIPLGKVISMAGLAQVRISESEKYPHVTYFFNCRARQPFEREDRIEVPSPRDVKTYDEKPEMSAKEITKKTLQMIEQGTHDFILVNFANPDMVGHTGNLKASIKAVEVVDECIGSIIKRTLSENGGVVVTADHGNVEELIDLRTGKVDTEHSTNPVPFMFIADGVKEKNLPMGILADIAPTILSAMGVPAPRSMLGRNLLA